MKTSIDNTDDIRISSKERKKQAEIALSKAKEIEAKRGKKVRFLKQGESGVFNNLKKNKSI